MDIKEATFGRRSAREYTAQAIDEQTIRRLIDAAVHAPNAVNGQPWTFAVVRNQSLLDQISRDAESHMLATMLTGPQADHFRLRLTDPEFQIFYHAPVLILISAVAKGPWIVEDCASAAENLMLAAYAEGLGSCWICFAQSLLHSPIGKKALGVPEAWVPVAPIIVGHLAARPAPVPRKEPVMGSFTAPTGERVRPSTSQTCAPWWIAQRALSVGCAAVRQCARHWGGGSVPPGRTRASGERPKCAFAPPGCISQSVGPVSHFTCSAARSGQAGHERRPREPLLQLLRKRGIYNA